MGKPLADLRLTDQPIPPAPPVDPRDTEWGRFLTEIDDLLATGKVTWAEDTLSGIRKTVEIRQCVTAGQRTAVANIEARSARPEHGRGSRRYEGFSGRNR